MVHYISNPAVNFNDKFLLSFNVKFDDNAEVIALGLGSGTKYRMSKTETGLNDFIAKINRGVVIDNGFTAIQYSGMYTESGGYITYVGGGEMNFFGHRVVVYDGKVYEEVLNPETVDRTDPTNDFYAQAGVLYMVVPGKYKYENDIVQWDGNKYPITCILAFEKGKVTVEKYLELDNLHKADTKLRFLIDRKGSIWTLAKLTEGGYYQNIYNFFYSEQVDTGYIYLSLGDTVPDADNLSVLYTEAV